MPGSSLYPYHRMANSEQWKNFNVLYETIISCLSLQQQHHRHHFFLAKVRCTWSIKNVRLRRSSEGLAHIDRPYASATQDSKDIV